MSPFVWANGGSVEVFFCMVSMVLVLWEVAAILRNGYRIQGQNYVVLSQGNEMLVRFHYRNLIFGI